MHPVQIHFSGNLVADPLTRVTSSGQVAVGFRVATTERWLDKEAGWTDGPTTFLSVTCWRQLAEHVAGSLSKGDRVMVTGRLRQRSYTTAEGQERVVHEVEADAVGADLAWVDVTVQRPDRVGIDDWSGLPGAQVDDEDAAGSLVTSG